MPKGVPKNGVNKGWFKKGIHPSTEFKKGNLIGAEHRFSQYSETVFKKGNVFEFKKGNKYAFKKGQHVSPATEFKKGQSGGRAVPNWRPFQKGHPQYSGTFTKGHEVTAEMRHKIGAARRKAETPLAFAIRGLAEAVSWRMKVFTRDNFTCQDCGDAQGGNLEAHHKKPFSKLFQEFLQAYSQFSPIEDKETLLRLAMSYTPFWDVGNGKTLCEGCHDKTRGSNQYKLREVVDG